jgi:mono/diheme cytochrome c family protein
MRDLVWIAVLALAPQARPGSSPAEAGVQAVSGAYAYRTHCATCHGADGKGEGPLAESLRFRPPDLTLIAKHNGGTYPAETVQRIVDGRKPLPGHGGRDMPVWGDAFKNADTGFDDASVQERIRAVIEHVRTLQAR